MENLKKVTKQLNVKQKQIIDRIESTKDEKSKEKNIVILNGRFGVGKSTIIENLSTKNKDKCKKFSVWEDKYKMDPYLFIYNKIVVNEETNKKYLGLTGISILLPLFVILLSFINSLFFDPLFVLQSNLYTHLYYGIHLLVVLIFVIMYSCHKDEIFVLAYTIKLAPNSFFVRNTLSKIVKELDKCSFLIIEDIDRLESCEVKETLIILNMINEKINSTKIIITCDLNSEVLSDCSDEIKRLEPIVINYNVSTEDFICDEAIVYNSKIEVNINVENEYALIKEWNKTQFVNTLFSIRDLINWEKYMTFSNYDELGGSIFETFTNYCMMFRVGDCIEDDSIKESILTMYQNSDKINIGLHSINREDGQSYIYLFDMYDVLLKNGSIVIPELATVDKECKRKKIITSKVLYEKASNNLLSFKIVDKGDGWGATISIRETNPKLLNVKIKRIIESLHYKKVEIIDGQRDVDSNRNSEELYKRINEILNTWYIDKEHELYVFRAKKEEVKDFKVLYSQGKITYYDENNLITILECSTESKIINIQPDGITPEVKNALDFLRYIILNRNNNNNNGFEIYHDLIFVKNLYTSKYQIKESYKHSDEFISVLYAMNYYEFIEYDPSIVELVNLIEEIVKEIFNMKL